MGKVRLHDSARPHTGLPTGQDTATVGWALLLHPPCSPDLAPPDSRLFRPLKDAFRGSRFADDGLKHSVSVQPRRFSRGFHTTGRQRFTHGWKKCVDNEGDPCKNNINDVKAIPITRVNLIVCNYGNRYYGVSYPKFPFNNAKTKSQKSKVKRRLYK